MKKTSNIAAYIAWILALCAVLMPPAFAAAGAEAFTDARDAVYALLEDEPEPLTVADVRADEPGWRA